jgi:hypothetical protein
MFVFSAMVVPFIDVFAIGVIRLINCLVEKLGANVSFATGAAGVGGSFTDSAGTVCPSLRVTPTAGRLYITNSLPRCAKPAF